MKVINTNGKTLGTTHIMFGDIKMGDIFADYNLMGEHYILYVYQVYDDYIIVDYKENIRQHKIKKILE